MNAKFDKQNLQQDEDEEDVPTYTKSSFFDDISNDIKDRQVRYNSFNTVLMEDQGRRRNAVLIWIHSVKLVKGEGVEVDIVEEDEVGEDQVCRQRISLGLAKNIVILFNIMFWIDI